MMKKRILVVDDDPVCRSLLRVLLEEDGHIGETAEDGPAVLTKLGQADYDAVLLDYIMPGPNGLTILQRIRQRYPSMPIVMITGHSSGELTLRALAAGARACLFKPFDCMEFKQVLTRTVGTAA